MAGSLTAGMSRHLEDEEEVYAHQGYSQGLPRFYFMAHDMEKNMRLSIG